MKFVTLAAPVSQFDAVARTCVVNQQFHPESAMQDPAWPLREFFCFIVAARQSKSALNFCAQKQTKIVDKTTGKWYIIARKDESNVQVKAPAPEPVMPGRI